jgi:outer membrane protein
VVIADPLPAAAKLIDAGRYTEAAIILNAIDQLPPDDRAKFDTIERAFLRGRIAYGLGDYKGAIGYYDAILAQKPEAVRVRLELARALLADGQYDRAERSFEFVLAGDVPKNVADNINLFLDQIYAQRTWRFRLNIALAPDTNINSATDSDTVDIFGLPFSLGSDARRNSGVGVFASGGVEYRPKLSETTRLLTNVQAQRTEYKGTMFDDTIVSGSIGPEMTYGRVQLGVSAIGFRRWYGTSGYNSGAGAQFNISGRVTGIFGAGLTLLAEDIHYDTDPTHNGPLVSAVVSGIWSLTPASSLRVWTGINREFAAVDFQKNSAYRVGFDYYREFPAGVTVTVSPDFVIRPFDATHPAFGLKRSDKLYEVDVQVLKRDFKVLGFAPYIDYTFTRNDSNIAIYRFSRHRIGFGLTRLY